MISTWKGFYHTGRRRKESNPFRHTPHQLNNQAVPPRLVSSGTCATCASEQGTAERSGFKSKKIDKQVQKSSRTPHRAPPHSISIQARVHRSIHSHEGQRNKKNIPALTPCPSGSCSVHRSYCYHR